MRTIIACIMLSCAAFAGAPLSEPYTREVKVPAAGWYRVPVDGHIWRYAHGRVLAFDENGKMLPCGILPVDVPSPTSEEAQPRLVRVEEEGDHLALYLEVVRLAGKHDRLILDFGGADLLEKVTLWGSMDGSGWKAMAQGTLFRLGGGDRMQGTALDYPASGHNHLKLVIPTGGGELKQAIRDFRVGNIRLHYAAESKGSILFTEPFGSRARELALEPVAGNEETRPIDEPVVVRPADPTLVEALAGSDETLLQLDLPDGSFPVQRIAIPMNLPHAPMEVSLLKVHRGIVSCEYSCTLDTDAQSVPIPGGLLHAPALIKINRDYVSTSIVFVWRPREEMIFFADRPGRVTLTYGGFEQRPADFPPIRRPPNIREVEPGPVVNHPLSLSSELAQTAAKSTQTVEVHLRWNLELPKETTPGQWVAVELTPEIKSAALGAERGDWGIMSSGRLVPSFGKAEPFPTLGKADRIALTLDPVSPRRSRGEMLWGKEVFPVIWLSFKAHNLGEPVSVRVEAYRDSQEPWRTPGEPPSSSWAPVGQTTIECGPWTSDCMAMMDYVGPTPEKVMITVEGRTLPPPKSIEVSVWRLRHRLVFPIPAGLDVQLISGTTNQQPWEMLRPHIAIDRIPGNLPIAKVGVSINQGVKKRPWDRILFIAGLVLAVAVLLYLIFKLLPKKEAA